MRPILNETLTVTDFDSGALAGTASVLHPLREAGEWQLTVFREESSPLATTLIRVRKDGTAPLAAIDLSALERDGTAPPVTTGPIRTGGYLQLNASRLPGGYFATLSHPSYDRSWDSRVLVPDDLFVCLPLRPGLYSLANSLATSQGTLTVCYPDPRTRKDARPYRDEPVRVRVSKRFTPSALVLNAGQGLVFEIQARARVTLNLQAPDDGPPDLAAWRAAHDAEILSAFHRGRQRSAG
jgi:hypothetical protein